MNTEAISLILVIVGFVFFPAILMVYSSYLDLKVIAGKQ
jgi:hypothetical protein